MIGPWARIVVIVCLVASPALAQFPKLPPIKQFGVDGFRLMLEHQGLEAVQTQVGTALDEQPGRTVLVILGDLRLVPRFSAQIHRFVERGGSLLVASDLREDRVAPHNLMGNWVQDTTLVARHEAYRNFRDCPQVRDLDRSIAPELFENVQTVIANRPGQMVRYDGRPQPIAWLPGRSRPSLMTITRHGRGTMLFVADHSLFVNEMLIHADNAQFASNVCRWLCRDGQRKRLVVIHDGRVLPSWGLAENPPAIPLESLLRAVRRGGFANLPIGDSVLPVINASIADYQQTNQFNLNLQKWSWKLFGSRSLRVLLLLTTACLVAVFVRWMLLGRSAPPRWISRQDWRAEREHALVQSGQRQAWGPALQACCRAGFAEFGIGDWDRADPPAIHLSSGARVPRRLTRTVERLWAIARAGGAGRVTKRKMRRALAQLQRLRTLLLAGELRLE